jgi:hypothetical protein
MQRAIRYLPVISATLLLLAAIYYATRQDFGSYLSMFVVLPSLLCIVLLCIYQANQLGGAKNAVRAATVLALLSPVAMVATWYLKNPIAFYRWSTTHAALLAQDSGKDHVIAGWRSHVWDDYLIRDTADSSSSVDDAEKWRQRMHLDCEIVGSQKVAHELYIVTTYNCPIPGVSLPPAS